MADLSRKEVDELVSRAVKEVTRELRDGEANLAFDVADLRRHVRELGGGDTPAAWEISYKTSKTALGDLVSPADPGGAAWEISYKTSKTALLPGTDKN